ncbi:hypothetical protein N5853_12155 [Bartonella sp. HY329]|uniref:hypothetical protein n=1 Tax=unclassified Bartonella TaxID=2645622 RepID=UPI0021CA6C80|nr:MULTISPECIES: hypothetical protein [unclassified Bartonella]UXM94829.1 hypothetical protein N5853_12155 [Bartonella sp. HY329]UXN09152.1 hypothetical protein N5852_12165 [Bartonella sp. HY328]
MQIHNLDFVGRTIGGNPATMRQVPPNSNPLKEWAFMFVLGGAKYSVHSCYGLQQNGCYEDYGRPITTNIKANNK